VVWEEACKQVTRMHASDALDFLAVLRGTTDWKRDGYVVGARAYQFTVPISGRKRKNQEPAQSPAPKREGGWIWTDTLNLSQTQELLAFLGRVESMLRKVAEDEIRDRQRAFQNFFETMLRWERNQEDKQGAQGPTADQRRELQGKQIIPTPIREGEYFSIKQVAEYCETTSRRVKAWLDKGDLIATLGPGEVRLIESGALNDFLRRTSRPLPHF
jgi:hypothetical protein